MPDACGLCPALAPLAPKSHVIPQWMYDLLPQDKHRFRIASSHLGEFEQRSQSGVYGRFVCQACEDRFAAWDDYAAIVLRRTPKLRNGGLEFGAYDYGRLARFYLSVLWRMSACRHRFFGSVTLNSTETQVRQALLTSGDDTLSAFEIVPSWSSNILSCGLLTPIQVRIESVPYWQIYMPRFQALIKVEAVPGAVSLQEWKLTPGSNLRMLEKTFTEFGEAKLAEQVFRANLEKKNAKCN